MRIPSPPFTTAQLEYLMEEFRTPDELRPRVLLIVARLRRLGLPPLGDAANKILFGIQDGYLADAKLDRIADLLAHAHVAEAGVFFDDENLNLDALEESIHSRRLREFVTGLGEEIALRSAALASISEEERARLRDVGTQISVLLAERGPARERSENLHRHV